jgi:hypothetical protein
MHNVTTLHKILVERHHPAATIIKTCLQVSNSPEFLLGVAHMLQEAAQKDLEAEKQLYSSLVRSLIKN